jgi:tRNA (uracil-5-)-methyltransferase
MSSSSPTPSATVEDTSTTVPVPTTVTGTGTATTTTPLSNKRPASVLSDSTPPPPPSTTTTTTTTTSETTINDTKQTEATPVCAPAEKKRKYVKFFPEVAVFGFPKFVTGAKLSSILKQHNVPHLDVLAERNKSCKYVIFENKEDEEKATAILSKLTKADIKILWKKVIRVVPTTRSGDARRRTYAFNTRTPEEKAADAARRRERSRPKHISRSAVESVSALQTKPYTEQLKQKHERLAKALQEMGTKLDEQFGSKLPFTLADPDTKQVIELAPTVPSAQVNGYRNKSEFTVGMSADGKPTVGFNIGSFFDDSSAVDSPQDCDNIPQGHKVIARVMEDFINLKHDTLKVHDKKTKTGFWRLVLARSSDRQGKLIVLVQINPKHTGDQKVEDIMNEMNEYLHTHADEPLKAIKPAPLELSGVCFQTSTGASLVLETAKPYTVVSGSDRLVEYLTVFEHKYQFQLSPMSFFQVNTAAAETLYQFAGDLANLDPEKTVLLDICCGTGTIGICLSRRVKKVIGLEIVPSAVEDAKRNAIANGCDNCVYICGNVKDTIKRAIAKHTSPGDDIVAIVDPPRGGVHRQAATVLRVTAGIRRMVYISCAPQGLAGNLNRFVAPPSNSARTLPFIPTSATPVDLFPHTPHCELVVAFDRQQVQDVEMKAVNNAGEDVVAAATPAAAAAATPATAATPDATPDAAPAVAATPATAATPDATPDATPAVAAPDATSAPASIPTTDGTPGMNAPTTTAPSSC